jgi:hypothetical protein
MKLNSSTSDRPMTGWSSIDAGRRVQVQPPLVGLRHFRLPGISVKRAAVRNRGFTVPSPSSRLMAARPVLKGHPAYLRALRAAEMVSWQASGGDALIYSTTS